VEKKIKKRDLNKNVKKRLLQRWTTVVVLGGAGSKSTNHELMKRVRVAYENRLRELRDELDQTTSDSRTGQHANGVDKSSSLSQKRLDVLLRKLDELKRANVSNAGCQSSQSSLPKQLVQ